MRAKDPQPSGERLAADIEGFARLVDPSAPGWTRRSLTDLDTIGREHARHLLADAGLETWVDGCGNVIGVLHGTSGAPALVTGSHVDTVQAGGRFDGIAGFAAALEAVRALREAGIRLGHDLRVVCFMGEETNEFGLACMGSRAIVGRLGPDELRLDDGNGRNLAAAFSQNGLDPNDALRCAWNADDVSAFVELHIEQGPHLERASRPIGIVSKIVGIRRLSASFTGRPDHAGTMPMDLRRDACCAAAETILAVERAGRSKDMVATTGRVQVSPGAPNVVPADVIIWSELRSGDERLLSEAADAVVRAAAEAGSARHVEATISWLPAEEVRPMSDPVKRAIEDAAVDLGFESMTLLSGAGHDASLMSQLAPTGMIFVPSRDGRSHCPEEFTETEHLAAGASVLSRTLLRLDGR